MRALAWVIVLSAATAAAQPGGEPQPPGPAEPPAAPPSPDTAAPPPASDIVVQPDGAEQATEPGQAAVAAPAGPLDPEGWPLGFVQEDLRGLPECGPQGLPDVYGAPITCRPHLERFSPSWSIGFDYTTGATFGSQPTAGGAHGWGVETHFGLSRYLALGARYEMLGISVPRSPGVGEHAALSQHALASLHLRLWTDEAGRNAFTLGGGAGIAIRGDELGGVAPMIRASLAREVGLYYKRHASISAIEIAYEHTLADPSLRAIFASLRTGAEVNVVPPKNMDTAATPSRHQTFIHMLISAWLGVGASVAVPLVGPLRWETTGDFLTNVTEKHPVFRGYEGAQWSARTGLSIHDGVFYALGQGGMSWYAHEPKGELDKVVHAEIGFEVNVVRLGGWVRWNLDDTFDSAGLIVSLVFGGGGGLGGHVPRLELQREWVSVGGGGGVDASANVNVTVPNVDVEVKVEPVVIEVPLGASVFGVGVRIDPRVLPIDKLEHAGFITVELSGPAGALADFRGQLSGTLDSRGVHVDGWTTVETGGRIVRAKFTIWPPGTHPPP